MAEEEVLNSTDGSPDIVVDTNVDADDVACDNPENQVIEEIQEEMMKLKSKRLSQTLKFYELPPSPPPSNTEVHINVDRDSELAVLSGEDDSIGDETNMPEPSVKTYDLAPSPRIPASVSFEQLSELVNLLPEAIISTEKEV